MNIMKVVVVLVIAMLASLTRVSSSRSCSKCGRTRVPYPLSISKDCGDPRYTIYCNKGTLEFQSAQGSYYKILSMNAKARTLTISPPTIRSDICYSSDLMNGGLRISESSAFNISNRNTVMLLNCSEYILLSPLNCSSNSLCRRFEAEVNEGNSCMNTRCCTYLKDASITSHRIRARIGGCTAYTSVVDLKPEDSPTSWNYGIELQWFPPN